MNYLSLLMPIAYLGILIASLATFSSLYRQRKLRSKQSLAPYFPPHISRNIYLSLLHLPDSDPSAAKVPESVLRAALLSRAVEDIRRIVEIRTRKAPLQQLLTKGVVGDNIWQRLLRAEQEMELEVRDVVNEANGLVANWGNVIFQSANEMMNNAMLRTKLRAIEATVPVEKTAWEKTREKARRELEGESEVVKSSATPGTGAAHVEKVPKAGSSDEDAVIVETPMESVAGSGSGGGKSKKKKGKK